MLSAADIKVLYADETGFILDESPAALLDFARAIEAEVRKQDEALIRQMLEALEKVDQAMPFPVARQEITAARARLGEQT